MTIDDKRKALWVREFRLNGFIVLRNFLPEELVTGMHDELKPLLDAEFTKAKEDGFVRGRGTGRLALQVGPFADLMRGALADDRYRKNPQIEVMVDAILGAGKWKRGWSQVEACWPGSAYMSWHSDQEPEDTPDMDAHHETIRVTYNIPLVDFTWANGATEFIPGSHRLPRSFHATPCHEIAQIYPVLLTLKRGDCVLRDGNALHRGTPNITDEVRPMLDQTYKKIT